jgi:hypothetical protein
MKVFLVAILMSLCFAQNSHAKGRLCGLIDFADTIAPTAEIMGIPFNAMKLTTVESSLEGDIYNLDLISGVRYVSDKKVGMASILVPQNSCEVIKIFIQKANL